MLRPQTKQNGAKHLLCHQVHVSSRNAGFPSPTILQGFSVAWELCVRSGEVLGTLWSWERTVSTYCLTCSQAALPGWSAGLRW